jgi:hypothetical protein
MAIEDSTVERTEAIFTLHRSNYEKLRAIKVEKGITYPDYDGVKIKGEQMFSYSLADAPFDFAMHTCGKETYPEGLQSNNSYEQHWTHRNLLDAKQIQFLETTYKLIKFDPDSFRNAFDAARGLWDQYLYTSAQKRKGPVKNVTGQLGDVLGLIASNYFDVLETVSSDKVMKKIGSLRPLERKGFISDKFFELFVDENFVCHHFEKTQCIICKGSFFPQKVHEWVGIVPPVFCGDCLEMSLTSVNFFRKLDISKKDREKNALEGVRIYTSYFGFIPSSSNQKRAVLSLLTHSGINLDELAFAMKVSSLLLDRFTAKEMFGSWAHFLDKAELLSGGERGRGGYRSIANDGHLCLSLGERAICEFLFKNGVAHEKEPMYPQHDEYNPKGLLRGDFLVNGTIIEFAGMMSNSDYAARIWTKKKLAKVNNIPWLKIETSNLDDLGDLLSKISSRVN